MKKSGYMRKLLPLCLSVLPAVLAFCMVSYAVKKVPNAVTYSVISVKNDVSEQTVENETAEKAYVKSGLDLEKLSPIGKYRILLRDGKILTLDEKGAEIYTVNADASQFPKEDITALEKGIDVSGREQLLEIISYLES